VIVDEWHELLGSKRGVLLELALSHLRAQRAGSAAALRVWGVSATLGNLPQALAVLMGPRGGGALVHAETPRAVVVDSLLPPDTLRFPWAGHLGLVQLPQVLDAIGRVRSTLLFTNTRAQAELWHQALAAVWTDDPATLALHHGSLDRALRTQVEDGLRAGTLRCVVATSSLDLGVDFAAPRRRCARPATPTPSANSPTPTGRPRCNSSNRAAPRSAPIPTSARWCARRTAGSRSPRARRRCASGCRSAPSCPTARSPCAGCKAARSATWKSRSWRAFRPAIASCSLAARWNWCA